MTENRPYYSSREPRQQYGDYNSRDRYAPRDNKPMMKKRSHSILPPPSILEAYEELQPGSVSELLKMAAEEQAHRHEWEDRCLQHYTKSHRIGQLFGGLLGLSIVIASSYLAVHEQAIAASSLAIAGFASLTLNSIVTAKTRRLERKPRRLGNTKYEARRPQQEQQDDDSDEA